MTTAIMDYVGVVITKKLLHLHLNLDRKDDAIRYLFRIPPPSDYWTDAAEYLGPKIDPFMFE